MTTKNKALGKDEVVDKVALRLDVVPKVVIKDVLDEILDIMEEAWEDGVGIHWRNFGSFDVRVKKGYWTKMPWEEKRRKIEKSKRVYFKPSKLLLQRLNRQRKDG